MTNVEWADIFLEIKAKPTQDPRIFQTDFERIEKGKDRMTSLYKKTYFCCVVGADCYGVDVIRHWATKSDEERKRAFLKAQFAADYYESAGKWPEN